MGGEVDHRDLELVVERAGYIDAVQSALQFDIHQDQVRHGVDSQPERVGTGGGGSHHFVPESFDTLLYVGRYNFLVLD